VSHPESERTPSSLGQHLDRGGVRGGPGGAPSGGWGRTPFDLQRQGPTVFFHARSISPIIPPPATLVPSEPWRGRPAPRHGNPLRGCRSPFGRGPPIGRGRSRGWGAAAPRDGPGRSRVGVAKRAFLGEARQGRCGSQGSLNSRSFAASDHQGSRRMSDKRTRTGDQGAKRKRYTKEKRCAVGGGRSARVETVSMGYEDSPDGGRVSGCLSLCLSCRGRLTLHLAGHRGKVVRPPRAPRRDGPPRRRQDGPGSTMSTTDAPKTRHPGAWSGLGR